jgi:hypothetical protein
MFLLPRLQLLEQFTFQRQEFNMKLIIVLLLFVGSLFAATQDTINFPLESKKNKVVISDSTIVIYRAHLDMVTPINGLQIKKYIYKIKNNCKIKKDTTYLVHKTPATYTEEIFDENNK